MMIPVVLGLITLTAPLADKVDHAVYQQDDLAQAVASRPMLRRRLQELRFCFAREATNLGALQLHFALVPTGRVAAVSVDEAGEEANQCVGNALANVDLKNATSFDEPESDA